MKIRWVLMGIVIVAVAIFLIVNISCESNFDNKFIGKIVFQSDRDNRESGVYVLDNKGIHFICDGKMPRISRDGKRIVFVAVDKDKPQLYVYDFQINNIKHIKTDGLIMSTYPSPVISPDGGKVAFIAKNNNSDNVFIVDIGALSISQVTTYIDDAKQQQGEFVFYLDWMPDSKGLIYNVWNKGPIRYSFNTKSFANIFSIPKINCGSLSVSPDGKYIAFSSNGCLNDGKTELKYKEIFLMDIDAKNIKQLTHNNYEDEYPYWSPDGKQICFTSFRKNSPLVGGEIYKIDVEKGKEHKLTKTKHKGLITPFSGWITDKYPSWGR